ncbi:MAG: M20/M25/M40 family metallo-hydrolase [Haloarculaceae archaeon]
MDVVPLTRDLVTIPSHEDETAAGDRIEDWLRTQTEATVERDAHGNVVARRTAPGSPSPSSAVEAGPRPSLALVGHHDVVPPDEAQVDADGTYVVEEREGRIYGRGTADMKGSLAAAMLAFRDADLGRAADDGAAALEGPFDLVLASFVGEEDGGVGCRAAIEDGFAPDYAVVGEGSTGYSAAGLTDVAVAHRGRRGSTIVAEGQAAHASEPEAGANAIYRATDAVGKVRNLEVPEATVLGHELTGRVVVTEIEGGTAWNVVPERCSVTVDERTVPGGRAALEAVEDIQGVSWTVDQDLPPMACGDESFAELVCDVAAGVQSNSPGQVLKPHATDAGWLAGAGTECVVVGAAEPGEAHTAAESVSVEVVERCRLMYREVAEGFGALVA